MNRDDVLARLAARVPGTTARGDAGRRRALGRIAAVVLGWLVLMTIWGFGRAWHGGWAPVELAVGLLAGTATTVVAWRRAARRHADGPRPGR